MQLLGEVRLSSLGPSASSVYGQDKQTMSETCRNVGGARSMIGIRQLVRFCGNIKRETTHAYYAQPIRDRAASGRIQS